MSRGPGMMTPPWNTPFASTRSTVTAVPMLMTTAGSGWARQCAASAASTRSKPTCSGSSTARCNGTSRSWSRLNTAAAAIRRPLLEAPIDGRVDARDDPQRLAASASTRRLVRSRRPGRRAAATPSRPRDRPRTGPTSSASCRCPRPRRASRLALRRWASCGSPRCGSRARSRTRSACFCAASSASARFISASICDTRPTSVASPCPVTAEMSSTSRPRSAASFACTSSAPVSSALLTQTTSGLSVERDDVVGAVPCGSRGSSSPGRNCPIGNGSTRWTSTRVRSTCRRNSWPRPTPCAAPSMSPGRSASTKPASPAVTMPRFGCLVVNGYGAISGVARDRRDSSVDLPAFGKPTSPASAMTLSSSEIHRSSPSSPGSNCRGARLVERLEVDVAAPALAALRDDDLVAVRDEVLEHVAAIAVADDGAGRDERARCPRRSCRRTWRPCRPRRSWPSSASSS